MIKAIVTRGLRGFVSIGRASDTVPSVETLRLVGSEVHILTREEVIKLLPDILGRALARAWIDKEFSERFLTTPKKVLADFNVHLPDFIEIDTEFEGLTRPRIVVYDTSDRTTARLLYLQLIMRAGR